MTPRGLFITFEGGEGCGKSTQVRRLSELLRDRGRETLLLREPGGTAIGESIRHLLQYDATASAMTPEAELLLFAASRAQLVREVILPALAQGTTVICDRYADSTAVYQGVARSLDPRDVEALNRFAMGNAVPDLTLLLDLDASCGRDRAARRGGPVDRMEGEDSAFYESVRRGYLDLASRDPGRFEVIDASPGEVEVAVAVSAAVARRCHGLL